QALIADTAQGICHGLRGENCTAGPFGSEPLAVETEIGVCFAVKGTDCSLIINPACSLENPGAGVSQGLAQGICGGFPEPRLHSTDPLLFCASESLPPQLLIPSQGGIQIGALNTTLLLTSLSVALVVDRTPSGLQGDLKGVPSCFDATASANADCNLAA